MVTQFRLVPCIVKKKTMIRYSCIAKNAFLHCGSSKKIVKFERS